MNYMIYHIYIHIVGKWSASVDGINPGIHLGCIQFMVKSWIFTTNLSRLARFLPSILEDRSPPPKVLGKMNFLFHRLDM